MDNEDKESGFVATMERLAECILVSRSTRDLIRLNSITDHLLEDAKKRDIPGIGLRLSEFANIDMLSSEGDRSRIYACRICDAILAYLKNPKK